MKNILVLSIFIFSFPALMLSKTFGGSSIDHGYEVITTSDTGFALLGEYDSSGTDLFVVKLSATGALQWMKTYGWMNQDDYAASIAQTNDGGYVVMGTTTSQGSLRAWLLRLNDAGDTLWTKIYYDPSTIMQAGAYVDVNASGYTIGINSDGLSLNNLLYLYQTDTSGTIIDTLSASAEYGSVLPVQNGYLMTATNSSFPPANINLLLYDSIAASTTAKSFFDQNFARAMRANASAVCGNGFLTVGSTDLYSASSGQFKYFLLRTDMACDSIWSMTWGPDFSSLNHIVAISPGEFLVAGNNDSAGHRIDFIWRTDSLGDTAWVMHPGNNLTVSSIIGLQNGNFVLVGDSIDPSTGLTDMWIMWYDSAGNPLNNPSTGLLEYEKNHPAPLIFPNPADEVIRLKFYYGDNEKRKLRIENLAGQFVMETPIQGNYQSLDISEWQEQIYLFSVIDRRGKRISSQTVIVR